MSSLLAYIDCYGTAEFLRVLRGYSHLLSDRVHISNNRGGFSMKPFVFGRKNWLFSNIPNGVKTSAIACSLIETVRENGFHILDYLADVLSTATNGVASQKLMIWSHI